MIVGKQSAMLPLLNLGEDTAVNDGKKSNQRSVTPRLSEEALRIQRLSQEVARLQLENDDLREQNQQLRDQPAPLERADSNEGSIGDPPAGAAERLPELAFFRDSEPVKRMIVDMRELYETDTYLVMPSNADQAGSFQVGFIRRPDGLTADTAGSYVPMNAFHDLGDEGSPEHLRFLVQRLQLVFLQAAIEGVFKVPEFSPGVPLGQLPSWGNRTGNRSIDHASILKFSGLMNLDLLYYAGLQSQTARLKMHVFLTRILHQFIIEAREYGIHFVDQQLDVTTPVNTAFGAQTMTTFFPLFGARYRIYLDRDVFLRAAVGLPDDDSV